MHLAVAGWLMLNQHDMPGCHSSHLYSAQWLFCLVAALTAMVALFFS
jgi:hypothetical protein